jgi:hypothetical protein
MVDYSPNLHLLSTFRVAGYYIATLDFTDFFHKLFIFLQFYLFFPTKKDDAKAALDATLIK